MCVCALNKEESERDRETKLMTRDWMNIIMMTLMTLSLFVILSERHGRTDEGREVERERCERL